jgi:uncharacterized protein
MLVLLFVAAVGTAALSATLGMAGGLVLMGVFTLLLPVPEAMVLHGLTQLWSNGGRAWLLRAHVERGPLWRYALGAVAAAAVAGLVAIEPPKALVYLGIGSLPWIARAMPPMPALDLRRPWAAVLAGVLVSGVQALVGIAGPLLDLFFLHSTLDRKAVVATKASTQVIAHALKIGVFAGMLGSASGLGLQAAVCIAGATVGTRLGSLLLERLSEAQFRSWSGRTILGVGAVYVAMGLWLVVG